MYVEKYEAINGKIKKVEKKNWREQRGMVE